MKEDKANKTDYIFLAIFGVGAIVIFSIELIFTTPMTTPRETALYNALELGLSLGFGWTLQRIDAKKQFHESLKQFALSAYRRINDIEKSVKRIKGEINKMRLTYPQTKVHELDILRMAAEEMDDTVNSSIADWSDFIGEELSKKERIQELQREQQVLEVQHVVETEKVLEIRNEINRLRLELPALMRPDVQNSFQFRGNGFLVQEYFIALIDAQACIYLKIFSHQELSDEILKNNQPYSIRFEKWKEKTVVIIENKNEELVGEIVNPFKDVNVEDEVFTGILAEMVMQSQGMFEDIANNGSPSMFPLPVEIQYLDVSKINPNEFFMKIPIDPEKIARG
jgi:hypothetical protein